jgi:N-acetylglucosamine malate deacetylase 1
MKKNKLRILAVGAHPDDLEFLCAGTLAKCRARGDEVVMCNVVNGSRGHLVIPSDELIKIRDKEAKRAAQIIQARHLPLGYPDCEIYVNDESVHRMVDLMREAQPDVIITHYPDDYMSDHIEASKLVSYASFHATVPHYKTSRKPLKVIPPIYYMDTLAGLGFQPEEYVDITDYIEVKRKMLAAHTSQHAWLKKHDKIDMLEYMTAMSRFRGLQCGVKYAEGFIPYRRWGRTHPKRFLP